MATIDERVAKLEQYLARLTGGAIVLSVVVLGYFGIASFYQIPNAVKDAVPAVVSLSAKEVVPQLVVNAISSTVRDALLDKDVSAQVKDGLSNSIQEALTAENISERVAIGLASAVPDAVQANMRKIAPAIRHELTRELDTLRAVASESRETLGSLKEIEERQRTAIIELENRAQQKQVHFLGKVGCDRSRFFPIPEEGTTTDNWLVIGTNPTITTNVEGVIGDNAIHAFGLKSVSNEQKNGWEATLTVLVNYNTKNDKHTIWDCRAKPTDPVLSHAQIFAIRAK